MKIKVLIVTAILMAGCASTGGESGGSKFLSSMPGEVQLKANNPYLLNCPANASPVCDAWGGRTGKTLVNCKCRRF